MSGTPATATAQESKTERAALAVTPHEKHALRFMTGHNKTTESELLRSTLIGDIVAEYERLMERIREVEPIENGEAA